MAALCARRSPGDVRGRDSGGPADPGSPGIRGERTRRDAAPGPGDQFTIREEAAPAGSALSLWPEPGKSPARQALESLASFAHDGAAAQYRTARDAPGTDDQWALMNAGGRAEERDDGLLDLGCRDLAGGASCAVLVLHPAGHAALFQGAGGPGAGGSADEERSPTAGGDQPVRRAGTPRKCFAYSSRGAGAADTSMRLVICFHTSSPPVYHIPPLVNKLPVELKP